MTTHGVGGPGSQPMEPKSPKKEKQPKSEAAKKAEEVITKKDEESERAAKRQKVEKEESAPFTFKKLPKELPPEIAKFTDLKDAVALGRTEKATKIAETTPFNQEIAQKVLWEVVFHVDDLSPAWKEILRKKGRTLKRLDLCAPGLEKIYDPMEESRGKGIGKILKELEKESIEFDVNFLHRSIALGFSKMTFSGEEINKLASYFPNIETLNLSGIMLDLQKTAPNLGAHFPHLHTLVLPTVDDKFLQNLTDQNLQVKSLVLHKWSQVSPEALIKFLASCKNLEHLEFQPWQMIK